MINEATPPTLLRKVLLYNESVCALVSPFYLKRVFSHYIFMKLQT